jgi:hypothetical protein
MKTVRHHKSHLGFKFAIIITLFVAAALYLSRNGANRTLLLLGKAPSPTAVPQAQAGDLIAVDSVQTLDASQAGALAKENYGAQTLPVTTPVTKVIFHYRSQLPTGVWITEYGRAYLPAAPAGNLPVFAFAPGTTGIGDQCAASLENTKKANWANYDSYLTMYASQGMAVVTTDYEGMRDPGRTHHYMVGDLEGRALLDAVRALTHLPQANDRLQLSNLFVGGYSQGGHAAFWADKIAAEYAPELKIKGVVGYGPVMSVAQTLADVTRGANINWFGPYVLYSYHDYYNTEYPLAQMLLPLTAQRLNTDVPAHCIDTDIPHWGRSPAGVYTPDFLRVLADGTWDSSAYATFGRQLAANAVGTDATASAKRINTGGFDNVVLPSQQTAGALELCRSSTGPVQQTIYPNATHYDTIASSLADTLAWMRQLVAGDAVSSTCPAN